jgi:hypothetical protein
MSFHTKTSLTLLVTCCAVLALALLPSLSAATIEVAQENPHASDDASGTPESPLKTLSQAAEKARAGDVIIIRAGTYRERVLMNTSGTAAAPIRFEAALGEYVVLTGADRLTHWQKQDGTRPIYGVAWQHKFIDWNPGMTHPADEYHRTIGRCEQVAINGYLLRQTLSLEQLAPGAFFVDVTNKTLFAWDTANRDLNKTHAEASVRQEIFRVEGDHIQLRGLHFRYAANMAQHGAVILAGRFNTMEDCVVEFVNARGASFQGEDAVVRRCVFRDNGQLGFGASRAHRLLFTESLVENNNTKNFDRGWEAGGNKLVLCHDAILERSRFLRNHGNGIWFDIGNTNCIVRQCLIADNDDAGIFYEISFSLRAHDNVIIGNGFAPTAGAWGAQAGISLSSSSGCIVERNIIAANREGFNFREQMRTTRTMEDRAERPIWNHDELVRNNFLVFNREAQVWGWFDVKDNRHWPARINSTNQQVSAASGVEPENIAAPYRAETTVGQPQDLTLEKLRLRFEHNIYFAASGQGWLNWGPTWARHQRYSSLSEFQSALGIDTGSEVVQPAFVDLLQLDFRLPVEAMTSFKDCFPRGPTPGVLLGER